MPTTRTIPSLLAVATLITTLVPAAAEPEPKIDCTNPSSTVEMNVCAERDLKLADDALNATYQRALKRITQMAMDPPFDAANWEKALRESQRAWLAYRDAECSTHVPMFWTGGTGTTVAVLGCMHDKTQARTTELRKRYLED